MDVDYKGGNCIERIGENISITDTTKQWRIQLTCIGLWNWSENKEYYTLRLIQSFNKFQSYEKNDKPNSILYCREISIYKSQAENTGYLDMSDKVDSTFGLTILIVGGRENTKRKEVILCSLSDRQHQVEELLKLIFSFPKELINLILDFCWPVFSAAVLNDDYFIV